MKIITSKIANNKLQLPTTQGTKTIQFHNYQAIVSDDIAEHISLHGGNFYTVKEDFSALNENSKVLVIRDTGLGDVLMVTPLLRKLKQQFNCHLDFATLKDWLPLFEDNPYIDHVLDMHNVPKSQYDYVVDLCRTVENLEWSNIHEHRVDAFGHIIGVELSSERYLNYYLKDNERDWAKSRLQQLGSNKLIAYVWNTSVENRSWSVSKHRTVLTALIGAGFVPAVFCRDKIHDVEGDSNIIDLTGEYTVRQTAALMSLCDACITPDTGLLHLATAIDLPTVCYWGAFPMTERASFRYPGEFVDLTNRQNCAKVPCRAYSCRHYQRDLFTVSPCLEIAPSLVIESLQGVIKIRANRIKKQSTEALRCERILLGSGNSDGGTSRASL